MTDSEGNTIPSEFEFSFVIPGLGEVYVDEDELAIKPRSDPNGYCGNPVIKRKWHEVFEWMEGK